MFICGFSFGFFLFFLGGGGGLGQVGHDVDHFSSPEGVPGKPETNYKNRCASIMVLSPARSVQVGGKHGILWKETHQKMKHKIRCKKTLNFETRTQSEQRNENPPPPKRGAFGQCGSRFRYRKLLVAISQVYNRVP